MDNLIAAIAFFVVVELIVFAAFSWRIKELEDRIEELEGANERLKSYIDLVARKSGFMVVKE